MKRFKPGKKKCRQCGQEFEKNPRQPFQVCCSIRCAIDFNNVIELKLQRRKEHVDKKVMVESLKTYSQWLADLQKVFNQFIRLRDAGKPCISCGCDMSNRKGDASHFWSVKLAPELRFNEDNVHLSCVPCNQYKSGNLTEYALRLPHRIGDDRFKALNDLRHTELKLSVPEIKELIANYKNKIKEKTK